MLIVGVVSWLIVASIFLGLLVGQLLHILEDSCTVSGINWAFPFGTWELKGRIFTFDRWEEKKDIRPALYQYSLAATTLGLLIAFALELIAIDLWILYLAILGVIVFLWGLFVLLSRSDSSMWYWDAQTVADVKKASRRAQRASLGKGSFDTFLKNASASTLKNSRRRRKKDEASIEDFFGRPR